MTGASSAYVVAVDQGTSSTKGLLVDASGAVVRTSSVAISQAYPSVGWVEQDANELLRSVRHVLTDLATDLDRPIAAVGLSVQRESALVWDRTRCEPLGPVIGWQDRRTADEVERLAGAGHADELRAISGLPLDPMFSAPKIRWLLDHTDGGDVAAGTIDNWIVFALTGEHRVEYGNASRTMLLDVGSARWSDRACALFGIDPAVLGELHPSNEPTGTIRGLAGYDGVPIAAVMADSHAALYGHGVREPGGVKVTYGTGSSVLGLIDTIEGPSHGLTRTVAWHDGRLRYAFEGNILSTGATVVWLAGVLGVEPAELYERASRFDLAAALASHRIDLVPAFGGMGAPWWDSSAQALISGLTLGDGADELAFAAVESIALQVEDVLDAADRAAGERFEVVMADGGPTRNDLLMQLQAEVGRREIVRSTVPELSAMGVARMAGSVVGAWDDGALAGSERSRFAPRLDPAIAGRRRRRWSEAVDRSRRNVGDGAENVE